MTSNRWGSRAVRGIAALVVLVAVVTVLFWQVPRFLKRADNAAVGPREGAVSLPAGQRLGQTPALQLTATPTPFVRPATSTPLLTPAPSETPSQLVPTPLSTPVASPVARLRLALAPELPLPVGELARDWAAEHDVVIAGEGPADIRLSLELSADGRMVVERVLVPVERFSSLREGTTLDELRRSWVEPNASPRLLITEDTAADLAAMWGSAQGTVELLSREELAEALWRDGGSVGIVPFDQLEPRLTPLDLDGVSVVDNRLMPASWPLALRVWLHGSGPQTEDLLAYLHERISPTNRDPERLTVLVMTGVTAMSRMTASRMERLGDYAYPAHVVGAELAAADITHISNEVPLVPGCQADPTLNNVVLCSRPEYLAALEEVGADIVGLTGNHQNDFGQQAMLTSLEIYAQHGLEVYAAGADDESARRPLIITHNRNRLAFLGANAFGPTAAWATVDTPGSARFDLDTMRQDISAVEPLVDVVLVELQHIEFDPSGEYQVQPEPQQREDFEALSAAGAHIVTGVQAHRPQTIEFTPKGIILFGLGNFFFDQMNWWETRQGLIARHIIYDGRHISTELLVTVLEDWAQPRWASPEERRQILGDIFAASGW